MESKMGDLPQALPELGGSTLSGAVLEVEDYRTDMSAIESFSQIYTKSMDSIRKKWQMASCAYILQRSLPGVRWSRRLPVRV